MPASQGPREATDTSLITGHVCAEGKNTGTLREADEGIAKATSLFVTPYQWFREARPRDFDSMFQENEREREKLSIAEVLDLNKWLEIRKKDRLEQL